MCWRMFEDKPVDLTVYLAGADALLNGQSLYDSVAVKSGTLILPFTYPPFAAVLMIPFALMPAPVAILLWALLSIAALAVIAYLVAMRLPALAGSTSPRWQTWELALAIYVVSGLSEPILQNFDVGQVNLFIVAAVLFDTVSRTHYRGFITGLAAGFKVTPGLFIVFMLLNRRWGDFGRALLGFATTLIIGSFFGIDNVWRYWTSVIFETDRVGDVLRYSNVGLSGVIHRALPTNKGLATIIFFTLAAIVVVACLWWAQRWWNTSRLVSASIVGTATLIVSPISWPHHWVWLVPAVSAALALGMRARRQSRTGTSWWLFLSALAVTVPLLLQWRFFWTELAVDISQSLAKAVGSAYTVAAVALVIALGSTRFLFHQGESADADEGIPSTSAPGAASAANP